MQGLEQLTVANLQSDQALTRQIATAAEALVEAADKGIAGADAAAQASRVATDAVRGIGATLDRATYETGDAQVIALSLMAMVTLVVLINRVFWAPLYRQVGARYKMDA